MANHKSALKRIKQSEKRAMRNTDRISRIKTFVKKFIAGVKSGESTAASFSTVQSEIMKGVTKGVLHKNAAARKISRLNRMLKVSEAK